MSCMKVTFVSRKISKIRWRPKSSSIFITGSYDDNVHVKYCLYIQWLYNFILWIMLQYCPHSLSFNLTEFINNNNINNDYSNLKSKNVHLLFPVYYEKEIHFKLYFCILISNIYLPPTKKNYKFLNFLCCIKFLSIV